MPLERRSLRSCGRAVKDGLAEGLGRLGGVGVVSVDHQVAIGVDIAKHLAAHVALSLTGLKADCGACSVAMREVSSDELLS